MHAIHAFLDTCLPTCIHRYTYTSIIVNTCKFVHTYECILVYLYVFLYAYIYIYIHPSLRQSSALAQGPPTLRGSHLGWDVVAPAIHSMRHTRSDGLGSNGCHIYIYIYIHITIILFIYIFVLFISSFTYIYINLYINRI